MKSKLKKRPPDCDLDIFEVGKVVKMLAGVKSAAMEVWINRVRKASGERVDWHYAAGRAVVKYVGDGSKVAAAIARIGLPAGATE